MRCDIRRTYPFRLAVGLLVVMLVSLMGCRRTTVPDPSESEVDPSTMPMKYRDANVIFVSFDALQAAHVSALGYPRKTTPTIDRLADQGFNFTHTYSVASWTVPASMTWFTGVYPSEHRMVNKFAVYQPPRKRLANLRELAPDLYTLAQILKDNDYATGGFTGNAGVSGGFGYEYGFAMYYFEPGKFGGMDQSIPRALKWVEANRDRKFFLFLHGYDAHGQRTPVNGYDYRYVDRGYDRRYTGSEQEQEALREEGLEKGQLTLRDADVRFWRAIYDEKINRLDAQFGYFLDRFEKMGLMDNTLFVLTSDHGTEFYEHRRFDHGFSLYNELLHVPFVVRLPGQKKGKEISDRVSSIHVMPTILDLLDVTVPEKARRQFRGSSLVPTLQGEPIRKDIFSETDYREYTFKRSILAPDGWKLIYTLESKTRELYHLPSDPGEQTNLAAKESARADELQARLFAHYKSIGHDLTARRWEPGLNPVYPSQGQ